MQYNEALSKAKDLLKLAGAKPRVKPRNFLQYGQFVADVAADLTDKQRSELPWFKDWALAWRKLYDDFDKHVAADPMILYEPAHEIAKNFHASKALVKWFCAGNRSSKTTTGFAEHYFTLTGQHRWRALPPPPVSTFIVGVDFQNYSKNVFEKKMIIGEDNNPLSPMFPEGGKWLHHYDHRQHKVVIACSVCANAGKARSCKHPKSNLTLASDESGWEVIQGAQFQVAHLDEHVDERFFSEALTRLMLVENGQLLITGTPLFGPDAWEARRLERLWVAGPPENLWFPNRKNSPLKVEKFKVSMRDAGLASEAQIAAFESLYDEYERKARIDGEIIALARNPVFDKIALNEQAIVEPKRGNLNMLPNAAGEIPLLDEVKEDQPFNFEEDNAGPLRVWEEPQPEVTYIAAVDTAAGLINRDASCCSILKLSKQGYRIKLELVAQYHGWINPLDYADEVMKIAIWYNSAIVAVELTGGLGFNVVQQLKKYAYWNIYRESNGPEFVKFGMDARFGIDTNTGTKPHMVAALQQFIKDRLIKIPCRATILELRAFEQERSDSKKTTLYRGTGGSPDDRTMSLVIGAAVAVARPDLVDLASFRPEPKKN